MIFDPLLEASRLRGRENRVSVRTPSHGIASASTCPTLLAVTRSVSAYPTIAQRYYACAPATALGSETEGGAGTLSVDSSLIYALNLGTAVPPLGTTVILTYSINRWVFLYN